MMIQKVLIPTDGYSLEDHVIRYVARAFPFAKIYVVSVINTYERGIQLTNLLYEEIKKGAKKAIERAVEILNEEGVSPTTTEILHGLPSKEIVRYAKKMKVDLIAMRVYSRKDTPSAHRMGSTVKNVLRKSPVPVLTLAEECNRYPIKRVLLLTDGTRKSKNAENFAIIFTASHAKKLEVMYVYSEESKKSLADKILKNVEWKSSFMNVEVEKVGIVGELIEKILERVIKNDVVIMGIGRRILWYCTVGHVAQAVATHSPVPVIFVRGMRERWSPRKVRR